MENITFKQLRNLTEDEARDLLETMRAAAGPLRVVELLYAPTSAAGVPLVGIRPLRAPGVILA